VHAASSEYVAQPNLAQIHVTKKLHDTFVGANQPVLVAVLDGYADPNHFDLQNRLPALFVYNGIYDDINRSTSNPTVLLDTENLV